MIYKVDVSRTPVTVDNAMTYKQLLLLAAATTVYAPLASKAPNVNLRSTNAYRILVKIMLNA